MGRRKRTDAERWELAERIATGRASSTASRQRKRVILVLIATALTSLIGALVAAVLGHVLGHHSQQPRQHLGVPWERRLPGLVVMLVGVVIFGWDISRIKRANGWFAYLRSPTLVLTGAQRRQVAKQIRGKAPVDLNHLSVLREVARRISRQRAIAPLLRGLVLIPVGQLLISVMPVVLVMAPCYLAGAVYWALWLRYDARRAENFLAAHPA